MLSYLFITVSFMYSPHPQPFPFTFCHSSSNVALLVNGDKSKCTTSGSLLRQGGCICWWAGGNFSSLTPQTFYARKLDTFAKLIALYSPFSPRFCAARWLVGLHEVEILQAGYGVGGFLNPLQERNRALPYKTHHSPLSHQLPSPTSALIGLH